MKITKTIQLNAQLSDKVTDDKGNLVDKTYATFTGNVNELGIPTVNYYISDTTMYVSHVTEFREAYNEFQDAVFTESMNFLTAVTTNGAE